MCVCVVCLSVCGFCVCVMYVWCVGLCFCNWGVCMLFYVGLFDFMCVCVACVWCFCTFSSSHDRYESTRLVVYQITNAI